MNRSLLAPSLALCLLLTGCFGSSTAGGTSQASSSMSSDIALPIVSIQGTVAVTNGPVPTVELISVIGDIYTLQSASLSLSEYDRKEALVTGTLERDAVSGNQMITVQDISVIVHESSMSSSEESSASSLASASSSSVAQSSISSLSSSSKPIPMKSSSSSVAKSSTPFSSSAPSVSSIDPAVAARIQKMARVKPRDSWTQQYCSAHVGVCFPVRGDFWYRSFAGQAGTLWHVELNSEEFSDDSVTGTGPLAVDLLASRLPDGIQDQQIVERDGRVIGYRTWTSNRHFEVSAPVELRASVEVIIQGFSPFENPQP